MKKFIFGIALFCAGMAGVIAETDLFVLMLLLAIAGFCVAAWEAFLAKPWAAYWSAEVTLGVLVDGSKAGELAVPRGEREEAVFAKAMELDGVRAAVEGRRVVFRDYRRGIALEITTAGAAASP